MAEISTQAVIDAITLALRAAYPNATILDDEATQGITPGAFIVTMVSADQHPLVGPRHSRAPLFDVVYFSDNSSAECVRIADALCLQLEAVTTPGGDLLHGTGISWRIEDYVLHFLVGYPYHTRQELDPYFMETLTMTNGGM